MYVGINKIKMYGACLRHTKLTLVYFLPEHTQGHVVSFQPVRKFSYNLNNPDVDFTSFCANIASATNCCTSNQIFYNIT